MAYRFLEDVATADVAFEASGRSIEELIIAASDATMNVMVEDLGAIERKEEVEIKVEDMDVDMLLFKFLNELIYYKDARKLLLRVDKVEISRSGLNIAAKAKAAGEALDPKKHALKVDVKAVTMHMFRAEEVPGGWEATVVLDI